jgi:site-specific recombinase XerD
MAYEIHKANKREALTPRMGEPYWGVPLGRGRALGYRKIASDRGSWIARMRPEAGSQKYEYKALGADSREFGYEKAKEAALAWFKGRDAGVDSKVATVADACREYVKDRRREKDDDGRCAHDAEKRFERTIYGEPFGAIPLDRLRTPRIKEWRDGLKLSKGSSNRTLTALKAALNLAVANRRVHSSSAREWADVKAYPNATKRRDLFLDLKQRRKLLQAAKDGALRDLMEGAALTGARAGELTSAIRRQFDGRLKTITFRGKVGARTIPLAPSALSLFQRLAKGKLPTAPLLTRDDGKPWGHSDWDELVRAAAEKAKLPTGVCLYTLRHSFITQAITDGMTTLDVARLCGTSVGMIEKHYGHLVADAARKRLAAVTML